MGLFDIGIKPPTYFIYIIYYISISKIFRDLLTGQVNFFFLITQRTLKPGNKYFLYFYVHLKNVIAMNNGLITKINTFYASNLL